MRQTVRCQRLGLLFLVSLMGFAVSPPPATAQDNASHWPTRPVKFVVAYAPGGGTDIIARVVAQKLSSDFGQPFVVENRPGASGMIGAQAVMHADPDGYTFLVSSPGEIVLDPYLMSEADYDPLNQLVPVTLLGWTPMVLAAHPSFEASTTADLVKLARAQSVDFSTTGIGSPHHLTGEYINKTQSTHLNHVPYRGAAPAIADAVNGQVKLTISGMPPVVPFFESHMLKPIAVTSKQRSSAFPDIPALAETPGFEDFDFTTWWGILAPAGTPRAIVDKFAQASAAALADPAVKNVLSAQAAEGVGNTPDKFRDFIRAEAAKYRRIVELTGVTLK
jgi:tripartite-type tricarboxylate transporter receptor subunit TctC